MSVVLGIDLGGTKLSSVRMDAEGRLLGSETSLTGPVKTAAETVQRLVDEVRRHSARSSLTAIGLGFPGLVDSARGLARSSVILPGFENFPLAEELGHVTGLPVHVDNDVNHAARAELVARRDDRDFLFLTVGTGIGGAVVLGGRVHGGAGGLAGELGHLRVDGDSSACRCGRRGCIGPRASLVAVEERMGIARGALADAYLSRDEAARRAVGEAVELLGIGIANALNLMAFPLVVVGGGAMRLGPGYLAELARAVRSETMPEIAAATRLEFARTGESAGAVGAALFARERQHAPSVT